MSRNPSIHGNGCVIEVYFRQVFFSSTLPHPQTNDWEELVICGSEAGSSFETMKTLPLPGPGPGVPGCGTRTKIYYNLNTVQRTSGCGQTELIGGGDVEMQMCSPPSPQGDGLVWVCGGHRGVAVIGKPMVSGLVVWRGR